MTRPEHLFIGCDGDLYDTRKPHWSNEPPLRPIYSRTYSTIHNTQELKATLRAGEYAWPGGYQLYLCDEPGATVCFKCARETFRDFALDFHNYPKGHYQRSPYLMFSCIAWGEENVMCDQCNRVLDSIEDE